MEKYFFILGRDPILSTAEIISVLKKEKIEYEITGFSKEALIVQMDKEYGQFPFMEILGGTIKWGKIIDNVSLDQDEEKFWEIFTAANLKEKYLLQREHKHHIGISVYDLSNNQQVVWAFFKQLGDLNITIKDNLKADGIKSGFVQIKERFLSSVSVLRNDLLTKGVEIVIIVDQKEVYVGKTYGIQEFEQFVVRDMGRPNKDKKSGIIPPKLARMMINLSGIAKEAVLLDPFCGSGTIIQEGIFLKIKNLIGCDISTKAVEDSKKNIEWLFYYFKNLDSSYFQISFHEIDTRQIANKMKADSIDAIVTEPFLGPPLSAKPNFQRAKEIFSQLKELYLSSFFQFGRILKKGGTVVMVFPVFEIQGRSNLMDILPDIEKAGFEMINPFPPLISNIRKSIIVGSKDSFLQREIIVFRKK